RGPVAGSAGSEGGGGARQLLRARRPLAGALTGAGPAAGAAGPQGARGGAVSVSNGAAAGAALERGGRGLAARRAGAGAPAAGGGERRHRDHRGGGPLPRGEGPGGTVGQPAGRSGIDFV